MCVINKSISIIVLTLVPNTFGLQRVCTRGSLLLIVNEDWCLKVVTSYKVSEWNPCILIFSVLCSVGHTIPLFFMFSSWMVALVMVKGIDLVRSILHLSHLWTLKTKMFNLCYVTVATPSRGYTNTLFKVKVWHFRIHPFLLKDCSNNTP